MEKCKTCYLVNTKPYYECSACINGDDHYKYWPNTQTNAQRIQGMSDAEMARFISRTFCHGLGEPQLLDWLQRPAPAETEGTE